MNKNKITILIIMFFALSIFVSAKWVYQENSTSYLLTNNSYLYLNYTKYSESFNTSVWQVKHGRLETYNVSIPQDCWSFNANKLIFRFYANHFSGYSYGQCYNGTWKNITNISHESQSAFSFGRGDNYAIDGDWDTGSGTYYDLIEIFGGNGWYECVSGNCFSSNLYEEAMWWDVNCTPNWTCSGYESCNISNYQTCNAVTDLNTCGEVYAGNYSEFAVQTCNYCSADIIQSYSNWSVCTDNNQTRSVTYTDNNYNTCCAITGLESDCVLRTEQQTETANDYSYTNTGEVYVNYTLNNSYIDNSLIWIVKHGDGYNWSSQPEPYNISVPENCVINNTVHFKIKTYMEINATSNPVAWERWGACYNGTGWDIITTYVNKTTTDRYTASRQTVSATRIYDGIWSTDATRVSSGYWERLDNPYVGDSTYNPWKEVIWFEEAIKYNVSTDSITNETETTSCSNGNLTINQPVNTTYCRINSLTLNTTFTDSDGIDGCWYNIDNGTNNTFTCNSESLITIPVGTHVLYVYGNDTLGAITSSQVSLTTQADITDPVVTITSPDNDSTLTENSTSNNFIVTFTATDGCLLDTCWYNYWNSTGFPGPNTVVSCDEDFNLTADFYGTHTLLITANDTAGNTGTHQISFNVQAPQLVGGGGGVGEPIQTDVAVPYFVSETPLEKTCGYDGNQDGLACDPNEDWISCPEDCKAPSLDDILCLSGSNCVWREAWMLKILLGIILIAIMYVLYLSFAKKGKKAFRKIR